MNPVKLIQLAALACDQELDRIAGQLGFRHIFVTDEVQGAKVFIPTPSGHASAGPETIKLNIVSPFLSLQPTAEQAAFEGELDRALADPQHLEDGLLVVAYEEASETLSRTVQDRARRIMNEALEFSNLSVDSGLSCPELLKLSYGPFPGR